MMSPPDDEDELLDELLLDEVDELPELDELDEDELELDEFEELLELDELELASSSPPQAVSKANTSAMGASLCIVVPLTRDFYTPKFPRRFLLVGATAILSATSY